MCTGASLGLIFGGLSAASSLIGALSGGSKGSSAAPAPAIQAPTPPPESQAASTPTQSSLRKNRGGLPGGGDPTLLTGAGGVANDTLTLGKSTLLGS